MANARNGRGTRRIDVVEGRRVERVRFRRLIATLGCAVALTTALALMLPAISVTQDAATRDDGFYRNDTATTISVTQTDDGIDAQHGSDPSFTGESQETWKDAPSDTPSDSPDADALNDTPSLEDRTEEPTGESGETGNSESATESDEGETAADANKPEKKTAEGEVDGASKSKLPAQKFKAEFKDINGDTNLTVNVNAPEGALPKGTTMKVEEVNDESVLAAAKEKGADENAKSGTKDASSADRTKALAVNITFYDADGKEIEPEKDVRVSFGSKAVKEAMREAASSDSVAIVHLDDKRLAEMAGVDEFSKIDKQHYVTVAEAKRAADVVDANKVEINESLKEVTFEAKEFSVYALVYTVDFHYEANGKSYDSSLPGGGFVSLRDLVEALGVVEGAGADAFMADVSDVTFSSPELVWTGAVIADTTVGELKDANGLDCRYSAELTDEDIADINAQPVAAGDWALVALQPFASEETLTVTMSNGDQFTIRVTDAQEIHDSSSSTVDVAKSYLICYEANGTYYLLKNDGTVDSTHTPATFENLNSAYCWTFNYVFEEKHVEETLDYVYYLIRPIDNKTKTIALNAEGEDLVQRSNNNVAVVPAEGGGFKLIGYNNVRLDFDGTSSSFFANEFPNNALSDGVTVHIYEMDTLPTYTYTARSADEGRGSVTISDGTAKTKEIENDQGEVVHTIHYYEAESGSDKTNVGTITATPADHRDSQNHNKWVFDHWTQDGIPLDRDEYPETIDPNTLPITFNGSELVAYFRQNSQYIVPPNEKQPSSIEDMTGWFNEINTRHVPLDESKTEKTAEVYDYENRIYRVDISSDANFETFEGNLDMAFCLDISNSMKFPSKLVVANTTHTNPMPIYQINDRYQGNDWWNNYDNRTWLDQSRTENNPYYLIADASGTATVFKIYYKEERWRAIDASRTGEYELVNNNSTKRYFIIGEESFETNYGQDVWHPFSKGDNDNTTYTIYDAGDYGRDRFYYLNQTLQSATTDLTTIMNTLKVAGPDSQDVKIAYNTFNKQQKDRVDFHTAAPIESVSLETNADGGTRPDLAFNDALNNLNWSGDSRYVVLITDGAPQGGDNISGQGTDRFEYARTAAAALKKGPDGIEGTDDDIKIITVGLSMDKVVSGKQLLYDLSDTDKDGNHMFYLAESASELPNIIRQIIKTVMDESVVYADVTDTVGDAFYLVDKEYGLPLGEGDMVDIEGRKTTNSAQAAGVVQADGRTIKWIDQALDPTNGWHGTVFVKAKEDFLGGNGVQTNGSAEVKATKYRMNDKDYSFDESLLGDKLKSLQVPLQSPRVNVNELSFTSESTEWTVYLGTAVDPETQLRQMYENIVVSEVVCEDGALLYPLSSNSITDNRESEVSKTAQTFALAPFVVNLIAQNGSLSARYLQDGELVWDAFLRDVQTEGGVTIPYHEYGVEGDDSNLVIKLTRTIASGEEDDLVGASPHPTTVVNSTDGEGNSVPVEKYVFTVQYNPDYYHALPAGQGGHGNYNFSTGTYGAMYQGHAAGRETSENTHTINVYVVPLDVYKTDENNNRLPGAIFKLYKADADNGSAVDGLNGNYVEVASGTSGSDGVARLRSNGEAFGLVQGETYYLIEAAAPENYNKVSTVWAVEVQTEIGKFTDLSGNPIYSEIDPDTTAEPPITAGTGVMSDMYPFNWDQGARVVLDGNQPIAVIARGETEGATTTITDGTFVSHKSAISFRHTVQNIGGTIDIDVKKTWEDEDHKPDSVEVKLYRVSEKDHIWGEGRVVPCTCTAKGIEEYACTVEGCEAKDTHVIDAAGHTPGTLHRENEVPATCAAPGSYDEVVRCTVCNAIISSTQKEMPKLAHTWVNQEVATTDSDHYCYDTANVCSVCNTIDENTRAHHDHDWGEWTVTTPAQPGVAGEETRICNHNSSHVEKKEIAPLPNNTTVTIRSYRNYYGMGSLFEHTSTVSAPIGSSITLSWTSNAAYNADAYINNPPVYGYYSWTWYGSSHEDYTYRFDGSPQRATRSGSNPYRYSLTTTVTENMTIDILSSAWPDLPDPRYISVTQNRSTRTLMQSMRTVNDTALRTVAKLLSDQPDEPVRAGESEPAPSMTSDELTEYLENLLSKDEASCIANANHTYVEELPGTYTLTAVNNWTLSIPDLPKFNEYGKEYRYYVVESPSSTYGYDVTYAGQNSGLQNEDTATINNKKLFGKLEITKAVGVAGGKPDQDAFPSGTYTYPILVSTVIGGTTYYVQDTDGTLGETPPETPLAVTAGPLGTQGTALTIENLPYGTYAVSEIQPDSVVVNGFSFVVSTDGPDGVQSITTGDGEVEDEEMPGEVALVNYYKKGARWQPEVTKWLNGTPHSGNAAGYSGYTFVLTEPEGQNTIHVRPAPGQEPAAPGQSDNHSETVTTGIDGKAVFSEIAYGMHDLHGNETKYFEYTITEIRPVGAQDSPYIADFVQYDTKNIYVVVTVTRHGNTMTADASYYSDEGHTQSLGAVEFDNAELASLSVTKTVEGAYTPSANDEFPITIKRGDKFLNSNGELVDTDPHLTIKAGQPLSFNYVPVGTYVVTEGDAERSGYTLATTYTYKIGDQDPQTQHIVLEKGDNGSVEITNTYYQTSLTIVKIDETTRTSATQTKLPNAKFKLYKYTVPAGSDTGSYTVFPNATDCEKTTNANGSLMFESLTDGRYRIDEIEQPAGYVSQANLQIYFKVENGEITWTNEAGTTIDSQNLVSYSSADSTFTVGNTPGEPLPVTGGPGTIAFLLLGFLLISASGAWLLIGCRKQL